MAWGQWLVFDWRPDIWDSSPMQRVYRRELQVWRKSLRKWVQNRKRGPNTGPSGIIHSEISRRTYKANCKVQRGGPKPGQCSVREAKRSASGDTVDNWAGWVRQRGAINWGQTMATGSGRSMQFAATSKWGAGLRRERERRHENSVRFYWNIIFIHYSSTSSMKPAKS